LKVMEQLILDTNAGKQLPQISNQLWRWKNEQHLNIDYNFDQPMSLSKSKCLYSNNCLHFLKRPFHCDAAEFSTLEAAIGTRPHFWCYQ
jgi:hypothetical protein